MNLLRILMLHCQRLGPLLVLLAALPAAAQAGAQHIEAVAGVTLADQYGEQASASAGEALAVIVVNVRRLGGIQRWQETLGEAFPALAWRHIGDINESEAVDIERVAATLRRRVPPGVPILMDPERHWARAFELDTDRPTLLLFAADGRLVGRFHGRWNSALDAEASDVLRGVLGAP